jgi:UPF0271 protein
MPARATRDGARYIGAVRTIDLNADIGEHASEPGRGAADAALLGLITSGSVACGFHAGDAQVMRDTVIEAARCGVAIGAHPGYPDRVGFGRRELPATPTAIAAYVVYQIGALDAVCRAAGTRLRYVKPHGALYNRAAVDRPTAMAIADAIRSVDRSLGLLALAGSALYDAGREAGLPTAAEAFADRAYRADGRLAPRDAPGAVLTDPAAVADRALAIVRDGSVPTIDGTTLAVHADSLCVHGDTPDAAALLRAVRARLAGAGVTLAPFAA